ncbi:5-oxoprolinase subunit PxpA [Pseudotenacibaculum haliotis]|uniref:5-oxoprolinase subunit PxpA n=1 Tax=Pseudotenacibaculum haliotis TaxID=1862138 RepID=A0ABW5LXG4_9FLAO
MHIDFNCDVGEGLDNEHLLMPLISSCNIACGGHAGSVEIIDKVIALAIENDVKIGAHPGYPDTANFGRVIMDISDEELQQSIEDQLTLFKERTALQNATVHHVKPHGALYNLIAVNREKAMLVLRAVQAVFDKVKLYVPYNSEIEKVALENGVEVCYEAFADRNYNEDLTLVSRSQPNAILTNPEEIVAHVSRMAKESKVLTVSGAEKSIKAQTFCIHGDNENVLNILKELQQKLT